MLYSFECIEVWDLTVVILELKECLLGLAYLVTLYHFTFFIT
jgi:hypothetical protein